MIKKAIIQAAKRENLDFELTKAAMEEIADGKATDAQIAAFLTAMRMKGETAEEITAAASVMKEKCFIPRINRTNQSVVIFGCIVKIELQTVRMRIITGFVLSLPERNNYIFS